MIVKRDAVPLPPVTIILPQEHVDFLARELAALGTTTPVLTMLRNKLWPFATPQPGNIKSILRERDQEMARQLRDMPRP